MTPYRADLSIQFESVEAFDEAQRVLAAFQKVKEKGSLRGMWGSTVMHGSQVGLTLAEGFLRAMEEHK